MKKLTKKDKWLDDLKEILVADTNIGYASGSPKGCETTLKEELLIVKKSARQSRHEPNYYFFNKHK